MRGVFENVGRVYQGVWMVLILGYMLLFLAVRFGWWQQPFFQSMLRVVPVPYAFVGHHPIWMNVLIEETETQNHIRASQGESPRSFAETKQLVLRRAVANEFAWSGGLWVNTRQAREDAASLVDGDLSAFERAATGIWNLSWVDYQRRVLKPYMLKQKLLAQLKTDPVLGHEFGDNSSVAALDSYLDDTWAGNVWIIAKD